MAQSIDAIISGNRRHVRMSLETPTDLTPSEAQLLSRLLDGWAEVAEMTEESSGLTEFGKVAKMLLGEPNWRRVLDGAHKYSDVERSGEDHGSRDTVVIDPHIATMSLVGRVNTLVRNGQATATEAAEQRQRLSAGKSKGVQVFVESRSALPVGTMSGGVSPAQAEAAANFVNRRGMPHDSQRMSLGDSSRDEHDAAAEFILAQG